LFPLHKECQRPREQLRVDRLGRHLYDVYQLSKTEFATNAIHDKELYETIVNHRYVFTRLGGLDYNLHQPQYIRSVPPLDFDEAWKSDYRTMQEQMIYGDSPAYEDLVKGIQNLDRKSTRLNSSHVKISYAVFCLKKKKKKYKNKT